MDPDNDLIQRIRDYSFLLGSSNYLDPDTDTLRLIEQVHHRRDNEQLRLNFNHPVAELVWAFSQIF